MSALRYIAVVGLTFLPTTVQATSAKPTANKDIVIAIVDDGLWLDDPIFNGLRWKNPIEISNNNIDDDGNGLIDDIDGWDVADQDPNVSAPPDRLREFSHGSVMALIIAETIRQFLGEQNNYPIKLLPIKTISDTSRQTDLTYAYQGLERALDFKADVINLSWSGGDFSNEARKALSKAAQNQDTFISAAVGSYIQFKPTFPAAHPLIFGIAGISNDNILSHSNASNEAQLSALSSPPYNIGLLAENTPKNLYGASNATARVSATVALMKVFNPMARSEDIRYCLQSSAAPVDHENEHFAGLLGAGRLNTAGAINCIKSLPKNSMPLLKHPEGTIRIFKKTKRQETHTWRVYPQGRFRGLEITPSLRSKSKRSTLQFYALDEADKRSLLWQGKLNELPNKLIFDVVKLEIELSATGRETVELHLAYQTRNIITPKEHCSGQKDIILNAKQTELIFGDGSAEKPYSILTDCKWLLSFPADHELWLDITELDTEHDTDALYLFAGDKTLISQQLMRVTGQIPPPKIKLSHSPALLWFVSNDNKQGQGFTLKASITPKSKH